MSIRASQVTAGIRGTGLWGRSRKDNEIICLIEGEVEVAAEGEQRITLNQPLQFYRRIDAKTQAVGVVEQRQLEQWAAETDITAGKGAARAGGRYTLLVASAPEQASALSVYDGLRDAGYAAELSPVKRGEALTYRVVIRQFASRAEAGALGSELRGKFGITEPKVLP